MCVPIAIEPPLKPTTNRLHRYPDAVRPVWSSMCSSMHSHSTQTNSPVIIRILELQISQSSSIARESRARTVTVCTCRRLHTLSSSLIHSSSWHCPLPAASSTTTTVASNTRRKNPVPSALFELFRWCRTRKHCLTRYVFLIDKCSSLIEHRVCGV